MVPGILGSTTNGIFGGGFGNDTYPDLPKNSPKWDSGELILHDALDSPKIFIDNLDSKQIGWEKIRDKFEEEGYERDCNIIDVPYDWRLSIPKIRNQYLRPWIKEAKRMTGKNKVDIVAHSMGGLVVRSYIQSEDYNNDIRNFVMVGTPNKGASMAYYLYNGDPVRADIVAGNKEGKTIFDLSDYLYTRTIMNLNEVRGSEDICFEVWGKKYDINLREKVELFCNQEKTADFIRKNSPSLGQLMPTYQFLKRNNRYIDITEGKNEFLLALNQGGSFEGETFSLPEEIRDKVENMKIFGGNRVNSTLQDIYVRENTNQNNPINIYIDGIPTGSLRHQAGDMTVLYSSLKPYFFEGISYFIKSGKEYKHGSLIKRFTTAVSDFINLGI